MLLFRDATTLAITKLKTRKVRLFLSVFVSSLLFSVLIAASLMARGSFSSVESYNQEGFGKRYIVSAASYGSYDASNDIYSNKEIIARAEVIEKTIIAQKKAAAKKLGVEYDAAQETPLVTVFDSPDGRLKNLDITKPSAIQAINEYFTQHPTPGLNELKASSGQYGATDFYESKTISFNGPSSFQLKVLKNGAESFETKQENQGPSFSMGPETLASNWNLMSKKLMEPFLLDGTNLEIGDEGSVPIVAPYSAVEQLLGMEALPASAKPIDKLNRLKDIRSKAANFKIKVCYRNSTSSGLIDSAISTQNEIEKNKSDKNYKKPDLIYGLPDKPCGTVMTTKDIRPADVKKQAANQEEFDKMFGKEEPVNKVINLRVVGLVSDPSSFVASGVDQIISGLLSSSLGGGWYSPIELEKVDPIIAKVFQQTAGITSGSSYFVEFSDPTRTKSFIEETNCSFDFSGAGESPFAKCAGEGKHFIIMPFGSNSLAISQASAWFSKVFLIAASVVAGIAVLIMIGTVGRIIADSRRESAVFRAIGAKKLDIALIYFTYTFMLSLLIFLSAFILGLGLMLYLDNKSSGSLSVSAAVAYNAKDLTREFHIIGINFRDIATILILAILAGFVSAILPLLANLRRNPIRDMRDEN